MQALRLAPAIFRFLGQDVIRARRVYFSAVLGSVAGVQTLLAWRAAGPGLEGLATIHMLALWIIAGPLCRSWLDEDVRLGYAAFWLQKPLTTFDFYLAWLLALIGWSIVAAATLSLAGLPAFAIAAGSPWEIAGVLLGSGWIPTLLVVLSFLGSALGARNSGTFAYGVLFAGFALPGFADAVWLGLEVVRLLRAGSVGAATLELWPIMLYTCACASLALLLALNTPARLTRAG